MSTELINKLQDVLKRYSSLNAELEQVEKLIGYAKSSKASDMRVELRFSAEGRSMSFPYPLQAAVGQLTNKRDSIMADMAVIEQKLEGAFSNT